MSGEPGEVAWWSSVRLRIALVLAVLTVCVVAGVALIVDQRVAAAGRDRLHEQATDRLVGAVTLWELDGRLVAGATRDPAAMPHQLLDPLERRGTRTVWFDGTRAWAAQRLDDDAVLAVQVDGAPLARERREVRTALLGSLGLSLVVAAGLGWLAAVGLSRRLRLAARLAARRTTASVSVSRAVGGDDEVAALSRAVDRMADDLERRIDSERRFGADVAHELRTPLTALVSAAELLPEGPEADLVRAQVGRMRALVVDLLEVFRAEGSHESVRLERADLGAAVATALAGVEGPATLRTVDSLPAALEARRLERVLANLVRNAVVHGGADADSPVELTVTGRTLRVRDHGPGFPPQVLAEGPRPFLRASQRPGSGLGLALAQRLAEATGARFDLGNDASGGAYVEITFAPPGQDR